MTDDSLLHALWTKAVGTSDYDKSQWIRLERELLARREQVRALRESAIYCADILDIVARSAESINPGEHRLAMGTCKAIGDKLRSNLARSDLVAATPRAYEEPCTCDFGKPCYDDTSKCDCGCPYHDTTRTPDAGRAEPKTEDCPEDSSHKGRLCSACGVCSACNVEMSNARDAGRAEPTTYRCQHCDWRNRVGAQCDKCGGPMIACEPGTSPREGAPDEAEREANVYDADDDWKVACGLINRVLAAIPSIPEVAALLRAREAAAREAGRREGLEEAAKISEALMSPPDDGSDEWADRYSEAMNELATRFRLAARRPGGGAKP